jgi:hypothetical protein
LAYIKGVKPTAVEVRTSWIRLLSQPRQDNPAVDMTGRNCPIGQQSEGLWFLQSTDGGSANRACTIPPKRDILCNILSCELSDAELAGEDLTNAQLEEKTRPAIDNNVDRNTLHFILDGKPLIKGKAWEDYKVPTTSTDVVLPGNNLFQVQPGPTRFAAYGFYVKLTGLTPGPHTLYFGGTVRSKGGGPPIFDTAVNYNLTQL